MSEVYGMLATGSEEDELRQEPEFRIRPALPHHADQIATLAAEEFDDRSLQAHPLHAAIAEWQGRRSPILVASGPDGAFLGYARCKPNEAGDVARPDGQVAVLAHVAVMAKARGRGIGSALVDRSLKTLRLLGYVRAFAQVQPHLTSWYSERGWTVYSEGMTPVWIEPPIPSDIDWFPDLPVGSFAPLLSMLFLPAYPHLAEYRLREVGPIAQTWFDNRGDPAGSPLRSHRAMLNELDAHPEVAARVPRELLAMMEMNRSIKRRR